MKRYLWLAAGLIAAVSIPLVLGGRDTLAQLQRFPLPLWLCLLGMIVLCWGINALRQRLLLGEDRHRLSYRHSLGLVMASEFAYCATPGGSGGPLTLLALLGRQGVRPAKASAVFAMDQLSDLLFFLCALVGILFYALFHHLNRNVQGLLGFSAVLLVAALLGVIGLARYHRSVIRFNGAALRRLGVQAPRRRRWARKLLHFLDAFGDTFRLPWQQLLQVFVLTCLHWGLRYSVLYLALQGLGADLQWAWTFLIQMLSLSAGQFSLMPGGAGTAELTSAALLAPMVGKGTAAAAILIWRAVTYYFYLIAGGPVFLMLVGRPMVNRMMGMR
ncbi:MAG: lysylphosphatidylglycerol synthase transmembrane domain-containing protein [Pseudomonas sp.]|nr:lysylphosphatidylglycerol synthase transmembrane domain-containing protein [Pseudomonas sp.]